MMNLAPFFEDPSATNEKPQQQEEAAEKWTRTDKVIFWILMGLLFAMLIAGGYVLWCMSQIHFDVPRMINGGPVD